MKRIIFVSLLTASMSANAFFGTDNLYSGGESNGAGNMNGNGTGEGEATFSMTFKGRGKSAGDMSSNYNRNTNMNASAYDRPSYYAPAGAPQMPVQNTLAQ